MQPLMGYVAVAPFVSSEEAEEFVGANVSRLASSLDLRII
jgi:hypothetical protein